MRRGEELTVEQVLVVSFIIQITTVLLDSVDAKLGRVNSLCAQVVGLQIATDHAAALLVGRGLGPERLDVSTGSDVIPLRVRPPDMLCGLDEGRDGIESAGGEHFDLVKESLGVGGHLAKSGLVLLDLVGPGCSSLVNDMADLIGSTAQDLLSILLEVDSGSSADQQS